MNRAKYQPYDALQQKFWREYLKQYDTDDDGTISHLELTSMLDLLGSMLSRWSTVESFWTRFNKRSEEEPLTVSEAFQCLETELCRPASEKRINPDEHIMDTSAPVTPAITSALEAWQSVNFDKLDFSGHHDTPGCEHEVSGDQPAAPPTYTTELMQQPLEAIYRV